jgi:hypothetical protein
MDKTSRALRRHHRARMIRKTYRMSKNIYWAYPKEDWDYWWVRRTYKNRKVCSCPSCGNPRRHFSEITLAEAKNKDSMEDQLVDYLLNTQDN